MLTQKLPKLIKVSVLTICSLMIFGTSLSFAATTFPFNAAKDQSTTFFKTRMAEKATLFHASIPKDSSGEGSDDDIPVEDHIPVEEPPKEEDGDGENPPVTIDPDKDDCGENESVVDNPTDCDGKLGGICPFDLPDLRVIKALVNKEGGYIIATVHNKGAGFEKIPVSMTVYTDADTKTELSMSQDGGDRLTMACNEEYFQQVYIPIPAAATKLIIEADTANKLVEGNEENNVFIVNL